MDARKEFKENYNTAYINNFNIERGEKKNKILFSICERKYSNEWENNI